VTPSPVLVLLLKIFLCTSLSGLAFWIVDYSLHRGWSNALGRTLLVKSFLLLGLLGLSALSVFLNLNRNTSIAVAWLQVALLALIGPVMVWRSLVFRRVARATRRCPNGHVVSALAIYCPRCGEPISAQGRRAD